jgi:hypothetical protein
MKIAATGKQPKCETAFYLLSGSGKKNAQNIILIQAIHAFHEFRSHITIEQKDSCG